MVLLPPFHLSGKEVDTLMRRDRFNAPLTEEEQKFAEENHYLIAKYLRKRRLPIDEWYESCKANSKSCLPKPMPWKA